MDRISSPAPATLACVIACDEAKIKTTINSIWSAA